MLQINKINQMKRYITTLLTLALSASAMADKSFDEKTCSPSAPIRFEIRGKANLFTVAQVTGDSKRTWVQIPSKSQWPVPFIKGENGNDTFLSWEDVDGCLVVALAGQEFRLGYGGQEVTVKPIY